MRETRVWSLGWEDPLEKETATHSSTLAWKIPWMEEPGGPQSMGSWRVRHNWATSLERHSVNTSFLNEWIFLETLASVTSKAFTIKIKRHHRPNGKVWTEKERLHESMSSCYRIKYSSCVLCMNGGHCYSSRFLRSYVVSVLAFSSQILEKGVHIRCLILWWLKPISMHPLSAFLPKQAPLCLC